MVTMVGKQREFGTAVKEMLELDYDAREAYQSAISRIDNTIYKAKLGEFMEDHRRHVHDLTALLQKHNCEVPTGPNIGKTLLAKGKVVLAELIGDNAILQAMLSNEGDTNTAYERMNDREDKWEDSKEIIRRGLEDEKRHKKWLEQQT